LNIMKVTYKVLKINLSVCASQSGRKNRPDGGWRLK
jgi:hypothetical protein